MLRLARRTLLGGSALLAMAPRAFAKMLGVPRSLEGPMVGAPGPTHFTIWVRASGAFDIVLEYARDRAFTAPQRTAAVRATAETDYCVTLRAENLQPATRYYYRLRFADELDRHQPLPYATRTAPAGPADFRVAFGSCCRLQFDGEQRIWRTVRALEPDMFFWLGDNIYADSDVPSALADLYRRGRAVPALEPVLRETPQLAIWDDHDFAFNDSDRLNPIKRDALTLFRNYWANPAGGEPGNPGVYFRQSYGGVDFFFLDGRYYRDPSDAPDRPGKTMLGARQLAWIKRELKASRASFKLLASGGGWSTAEKEEGGDSWGVYLHERDALFDFIRDARIEGVVCISGDSHMGELNCVPRSEQGGYDIYDFCSSPLAQMPATKFVRQNPEIRIRDVWSRSVNVGVIQFSMNPVPTLTYTLHDVLGEAVWDPLVLTPADLKNGVKSWERLIDPKELKRLRRFQNGGAYYASGD